MADPSVPVARLDIGEREHRIRVYAFMDDHELRIRVMEGKITAILTMMAASIGLLTTILATLLVHG
jgi:hypothetical protein